MVCPTGSAEESGRSKTPARSSTRQRRWEEAVRGGYRPCLTENSDSVWSRDCSSFRMASADEDVVLFEGCLVKSPPADRFVTKWRERWFALLSNPPRLQVGLSVVAQTLAAGQ